MHCLLRHLRGDLLVTLVLSSVCTLPAIAQTAAPAPVKQVPAGSTATIGPAKSTPAATPSTPQGQILKAALGPDTRQTLQQAMDSTPAPK